MMNVRNAPQFRKDLVATPIFEEGEQYVDVTDPNSGKTFRFFEVEYAIASAMDGARTVDSLAAWAEEELGLEAEAEELTTLVSTLNELGYLEGVDTSSQDSTSSTLSELADGPTGIQNHSEQSQLIARSTDKQATIQIDTNVQDGLVQKTTGAGFAITEDPIVTFEINEAEPGETDFGLLTEDVPTIAIDAEEPPLEENFGEGMVVQELVDDPSSDVMALDMDEISVLEEMDMPPQTPPSIPRSPSSDATPLSVDLSQHMNVDSSAVQEAVRQSQVEASEPHADDTASLRSSRLDLVDDDYVEVETKSSAVRSFLVGLVGLLVLAGGAYYLYDRYYLQDDRVAQKKYTAPVRQAYTPPAPPAPIASILQPGPDKEQIVRSKADGQLVEVMAIGSEVQKGDVVAKFAGYDTQTKNLEALQKKISIDYAARMKRFRAERDKAIARKRRVAERKWQGQLDELMRKIENKKKKIKVTETALDKLLLRSTVAGKIAKVAAENTLIKLGDTVVSIMGPTGPIGVFTVPADKWMPGDNIELENPKEGAIENCSVLSITGPQKGAASNNNATMTVQCPISGKLEAASKVLLVE